MAALINLFQHMPRLNELIVTQWDCNLKEHGLKGMFSNQYAGIFPHSKTTWANLAMIGSALEASHNRIHHMTLPAVDPLFPATDTSLETLFKTLTSLSFNIKDLTFMTARSHQDASTFLKLLQCASETSRKLDFRNHTESHPQLPETDDHFLEKLFQDPESDAPDGIRPLLFPRLTTLKLRSIILNTPSLIAFLSRQPVLEYAEFEYIYLTTIGYKWSDVAIVLPSTCQKFSVNSCGHEPYGPSSPIAENHIIAFKPYQQPFPAGTGW
ncbi:hypothetical protein BCR34DRAFT_343589 [Clohesyomyces aquaticus]|uniref:F-box domain-containing protein n=1 Tax=Clohesyomyces aquaticus TaxID=1231657 RepID=A0A1Y2A7F8_9PLEO|nr:hypothetical protein BCR34DRAFT_343589 [Clohesyomyces aquaticus]